ncbi:MAG: hypothetical protein WBJ91_03920, partial [Dethiobacteria bacterium]
AHGSSLAELRSRPGLRKLLDEQIFERALVLGWSRGAGTVEQLCDLTNKRGPELVSKKGWPNA